MAVTVSELQARMSVDQSSKAKFKRDMGDADSTMDRLSKSGSRSFSALGRAAKVGFLAAGAAIGTGLAVAAKVGFDEFNQGQKVAAQTAAVLKSTGGVANVTAKQIDALGTSIMNKTGIDDEAIKSGENMLLTFKNIRNEAGKGNDIFNQTTRTLTDMTVALGSDPQKQAIQLGKALNDPVAGLSALQRVGVTFTQGQKDAIAAMVESGHTMKAQKTILKELNSEFGGSAEAAGKTLSGQLNILKETFSNTAGEIVGKFVPILLQVAKAVLPLLLKGLDYVVKGLEFMAGIISQIVQGIGFGAFGKRTEDDLGRVGTAAIGVGRVLKRIWVIIKENVVPIVLSLRDIAVETFHRMAKVIEDNRPQLERIAERLGKLIHVLGVVLLPIIKLVFQEVLPRVLNIAIKIIDDVSAAIETVVRWIGRLVDFVRSHWATISKPFRVWWDVLKAEVGLVRDLFGAIKAGIDKVAGPLGKVVDAFGAIKGAVSGAAGAVGGFFGDGIVGIGTSLGAAAGAASISPTLYDDLGLGQSMGLSLSSGYRPGAVTSTGNPSLHGVYPAKAIDMSGSETAMRRFFLAEVVRGAATGLREVIHSPYWWHPGVGITSIPASAGTVLADHYNHVHVGSYDQGGYLRPGWNIAYNGLGRNEPVGFGGVTINVAGTVIAERDLHTLIRRLDEDHRRRNG